jgi:hypothetical protein
MVEEEVEVQEARVGRRSWLEYWLAVSRSCARHEEASTLEPTAARHIYQIPRHPSGQCRRGLSLLHQHPPVHLLRLLQEPHLQFPLSPS